MLRVTARASLLTMSMLTAACGGDDDGDRHADSLQFALAVFTVNEDGTAAAAQVTVTRSGGASGAVSVTVSSRDGSANSDPNSTVEPVDYTPVGAVVNFADQDAAPKTVTLEIRQDLLPESDETFTLELSAPTGPTTIGEQATAMLTIVDDDAVMELQAAGASMHALFGSAFAAVAGRIAIGAPGQDVGGGPHHGAVFLIDASTGASVGSLPHLHPPRKEYRIGEALAAIGSQLVVGAPRRGLSTSGFAYLFDVTSSSQGVSFTSPLCAGAIGAGRRLAVVGGHVVVAGFGCGTFMGFNLDGIAGFFDPSTGMQVGPSIMGTGCESLGESLAALDSRLIVGAPELGNVGAGNVYVFDALGTLLLTRPNPSPSPGDQFGFRVACAGNRIAASAPADDQVAVNAGAVYVFDATSGSVLHTILPPMPLYAGAFGSQLAYVRDRLAVQWQIGGVQFEGMVLIYDADGALIQSISHPQPTVNANFGAALAAFDGQLIVGAPEQDIGGPQTDVGAAWVFKVN
jgi:hypothetical protein